MFNLLFIVLRQNLSLVLITSPAMTLLEHRSTPFGVLDLSVAALFLPLLVGETVADEQQWRLHDGKRAETAACRTPSPQFLQGGRSRVSRHPDFFIGSTILTEGITRSRYPEYAEYAEYPATTSAIVPWFPRGTRAPLPARTA